MTAGAHTIEVNGEGKLKADGSTIGDTLPAPTTFHLVKVVIKRDGTEITQTQDIMVGERLNLSVDLEGAPEDTEWWPDWALPGAPDTIKQWVATNNFTERIDIEDDDLVQKDISFAWVTGNQEHEVNCTVTIPDVMAPDRTVKFRVFAPVVDLRAVYGDIAVSDAWREIFGDPIEEPYRLHIGIPAFPGFNIFAALSVPPWSQGQEEVQWVQNITSYLRRRKRNGHWEKVTGPEGLDKGYPYPMGDPGPQGEFTMNDSPSTPLTPADTERTMEHEFALWFMYRPTGGGIWVPLKKVTWGLSASATRTGATWNPNTVPPNATFTGVTKAIAGGNTIEYPSWNFLWNDAAKNNWVAE